MALEHSEKNVGPSARFKGGDGAEWAVETGNDLTVCIHFTYIYTPVGLGYQPVARPVYQ